eukprot:CAMPEP_0206177380 /NCGR_PEP_ID=MMETSP1474-20131121/61146_1 /ASSEMBLY_ACC=CAM_ASM_001110 /TAXON_ID=97495 /ORGANISM="Imantonia sp., Strain RCC918" /LENGTH=60 /DNA_ID=CAMNT_0053589163 /DNA_START=25 /DNA_END=204 /DNA_ORIENTATION=+
MASAETSSDSIELNLRLRSSASKPFFRSASAAIAARTLASSSACSPSSSAMPYIEREGRL